MCYTLVHDVALHCSMNYVHSKDAQEQLAWTSSLPCLRQGLPALSNFHRKRRKPLSLHRVEYQSLMFRKNTWIHHNLGKLHDSTPDVKGLLASAVLVLHSPYNFWPQLFKERIILSSR